MFSIAPIVWRRRMTEGDDTSVTLLPDSLSDRSVPVSNSRSKASFASREQYVADTSQTSRMIPP
jgi:hypothetical protein